MPHICLCIMYLMCRHSDCDFRAADFSFRNVAKHGPALHGQCGVSLSVVTTLWQFSECRSQIRVRLQVRFMLLNTNPNTRPNPNVGLMLGPLLFCIFTTSIGCIISDFNIAYHQYADNLQLYIMWAVDYRMPQRHLQILGKRPFLKCNRNT